MKKKRNWGGKRDKHFGPFTWTSSENPKEVSYAGVEYIVEPNGNNVLRVSLKRGTLHCELPRFLKAAPPRDCWDNCFRRYGFEIHFVQEPHDTSRYKALSVTLSYGEQAEMSWSKADKRKTWYFPWAGARYLGIAYLTENHSVVASVFEETTRPPHAKQGSHFDYCRAVKDLAPTWTFALKDYDDEIIACTTSLERRLYVYGSGRSWFWRLLNGFKTFSVTSLDLEFGKEVGRRKHDWKGGTVGASIVVQDGESPWAAFSRWCLANGATPLEPVQPQAPDTVQEIS